jgi:hypothetical protein
MSDSCYVFGAGTIGVCFGQVEMVFKTDLQFSIYVIRQNTQNGQPSVRNRGSVPLDLSLSAVWPLVLRGRVQYQVFIFLRKVEN